MKMSGDLADSGDRSHRQELQAGNVNLDIVGVYLVLNVMKLSGE